MARTREGARLTERHRNDQLAVRARVLRNLLRLWRAVDPLNLSATINPFAQAAAALVENGNRQSASLAADYYRAFRAAEGARGALALVIGEGLDLDAIAEALRAAGLSGISDARRRGDSTPQAARNGFVRVAGSASRLTLDGGRRTIREAVQSDPVAIGWQRVTDGNPCAFCAMLASRGAVYLSERSATEIVGRSGRPRGARQIGESFHDNCGCGVEPVFDRDSALPPRSEEFQTLWRQATAGLHGRDAVNAFRRAIEGRIRQDDPIVAG